MNLIVGLGNPGSKYASTRHNIGFMVVDQALKNIVSVDQTWENRSDIKCQVFKSADLVFAKPQSFMNASGFAVKKLMDLYKIPVEQLWVIHDDIDLPLGKIRIRVGGGSAGHHGIESIMRELGNKDQFVRFRLGVGKDISEAEENTDHSVKHYEIEKYVVSNFTEKEAGEVRHVVKHAAEAIDISLHKGLDKAMSQFN